MDLNKIVEMLESSPEAKTESKRILNALMNPTNELQSSSMMTLIALRMAGTSIEEILAMSFALTNKVRRITGISEDEMMEVIKKYK